ncbi:MAG: restriction endonuclease subunit S [Candidatus Riflebacteria bacterium]
MEKSKKPPNKMLEPWLPAIPKTWKCSRIKNVSSLSPGFSGSKPDPEEICCVVPMENMSQAGTIDLGGLLPYKEVKDGLTLFEAGDVLFAKITPCMENGKGAFVPRLPTRYAFGSTEFHVLRPFGKVDPRFLYYYTFNSVFRAYAAENMSGAAGQKRVSSRFLKETILFLPELLEQQRIAAYLDKTCAAIDAAVASKRKQIELLSQIFYSEMNKVFSNTSFPWVRIKNISLKIGSGVTPEGGATVYQDKGIPFLRSQNIHFDGLKLEDVAFISEEIHNSMKNSQLQPGDVLVNITGASIGRCTCLPANFSEGNVNQHVCIIRPNHQVNSKFLAYFLASPLGQSQIFSSFTGASRQGLSHKELGLIKFPLPSFPEQCSIAENIELRKNCASLLRFNINAQIDTLLSLRKSLIHECVTGLRKIDEAQAT